MIGLIVEDSSDERAVREICKKLNIETEFRRMRGNDLKKAKRFADLLFSEGCKNVIVLKDLHSFEPSALKTRFAQTGFEQQAKLCIVVRAIEAWLLSDEKALGDYLGSEVKRVHEPEAIEKPNQILDKLFNKKKGRPYLKGGEDPAEIAKRLRLQVVERKCGSFKEFRETVQN